MQNQKNKSAQSILEYVIVLAAILTAILANTYGLHRGVQASIDQQQGTINTAISGTQAPQDVKGQKYYTDPHERTSDPAWGGTDTYGGPSYTGGYDYEEWARNNPESAYNAPAPGTIIPLDNSTSGN